MNKMKLILVIPLIVHALFTPVWSKFVYLTILSDAIQFLIIL